jgi:outer membrane protein TolC
MRYASLCLFLVFSTAVCQLVVAQEKILSLENTLDIVRKYHPVAKQSVLLVDMAEANLQSSRGAFDPSFYTRNEKKTFDGKNYFFYSNPELKIPTWYGIEIKGGLENNYGDKLSAENTFGKSSYVGISIPLLKDLIIDKRRTDLAQSKILVNLNQAERQLVVNDLYLDGASSFWSWTYAYQKQKLFTEVLDKTKEISQKEGET